MIVETGSGVANADAYTSLADFRAYHAARGNAAVEAATDDACNAAIVLATDYLEITYEARARRKVATQGLQWPTGDAEGLEPLIVRAVMLLAAEALSNDLTPRIERGTARQLDKLDGVGMTETYFDAAPVLDHYPQVTAMLSPVARHRSASGKFGRVSRDLPQDPRWCDYSNGIPGNGLGGLFGYWGRE
ncbi:MAG: hypothetical protein E7773_10195 [Sphingomonas sp.]|uniref:DnaT-like ssDNA-binding protein n=1 Tax=Sphingomonas sp. TaxID=28214 RepID=UPI0011FC24C0|nr:DnaT-like ssDNA-binding protein [Sphingomonas sp.]THD35708.1 MAG: hypothetical protein E7773_10195 [Sphingomonas sp.]